jgi:hypothetical protein
LNTPKWFVEYCESKNNELQKYIENRKVIFLDTKIWIKFRECVQGDRSDGLYHEIYESLRTLVRGGKAICPVVDSVFFELLKRQKKEDVALIFEIVHELGNSLMQSNIGEIARNETLAMNVRVEPPLFVYKVQSQYATFPIYTDDNPKAVEWNRSVLDRYFDTSIGELFAIKAPEPQFYYKEYVDTLFRDLKRSIADREKQKYKSFQRLRAFELEAVLDELYSRFKDEFRLPEDFVDRTLKDRDVNRYMPLVYNTASMYAWVRWSELNNLESNDIFDLMTFPCAIGYADYFFAERKYTDRIKNKPLELDRTCRTIVESEERGMLNILSALDAGES